MMEPPSLSMATSITNNSAATTITSTRAASRKTRVYVFREFLVEKYFNDNGYLQKGDVVLDVAGGKGDLSWLLWNVDGINSVVMDPRGAVGKSHIIKSVRYLQSHPEEAQQRAIPNLPTFQPLAALLPKIFNNNTIKTVDDLTLPQHLKILVNDGLVAAVKEFQETQNEESWMEFWKNAVATAIQAQDDCGDNLPDGTQKGNESIDISCNQDPISDAIKALQTIHSAKLIVGFHPDQATDACWDLAQLLRIPFCVVPCCVFPKEFPHRRIAGGKIPVKKYPQLIEYLEAKSTRIRKDKLHFNFTDTAKNLVLYTLP